MIGRKVTEGTHLIPGEVYVARPLPANVKRGKSRSPKPPRRPAKKASSKT